MIKKIALSLILVCLFIAIPLAVIGIKKVELGSAFLGFMRQVSATYDKWDIAIPTIPTIDKVSENNNWFLLLNAFIDVVNVFSRIVNILILILNIAIQLFQFVCSLLWEIIHLIDFGKSSGDSSYSWAWLSNLPIL